MDLRLDDRQREYRERARRFGSAKLAPCADDIDQRKFTPREILDAMRGYGYLGAALPTVWGGEGMDPVSYGLVTEEIGKICSSVRSLMTVHNMSAQAITKLGDNDQQRRWLPDLCAGRKIIAFALSERNLGSASNNIETEAVEGRTSYFLTGTKKWVTYGLSADLFLVFAQTSGKAIALVVDRNADGLVVEPEKEVLGTRGAMVAQLHFNKVEVSKDYQVGSTGMGMTFVANAALDHGRFSVAWGSTGIIQACLEACLSYTQSREQGGSKLKDYQLVRRQLTDMLVAHSSARALCYRSACLRQQGDPRAVMETSIAKYYASKEAMRVAVDAVHVHGANGCSVDFPVNRYLRDATVMGIVEGTHEIHQISIASYAFQKPYLD